MTRKCRNRSLGTVLAFLLIHSLSDSLAAGGTAPAPNWVPPILSPQEEARTFLLPPGYHLELVMSEPQIREPVWCTFDGNGRMYVVEMRSYMQDLDGKGEFAPISRISRHESTRNDGHFDRHTVFADHLVLPREILTLGRGQVVVGRTNTNDLTLYHDSKDRGVADSHELFYAGGPFTGNMEHQPSGLIWSIDNWIYSTYNAYRLRWQPHGPPLREPTATNGGQWGLSQDDEGKLWLSNAGGEHGLLHFQTPIVYAALDARGMQDAGFPVVWPAIGLADFQGGSPRVREPDHTLNHFTASAGQEVYRGNRLPAELRGNVFIGEPVGRLVRRAVIAVKDGITTVSNPYQAQQSEFLRSTDPYFRPVDLAMGPDGCLYIVDMYRGIIQEGNWTKPGSYLRPMIADHQLEKNIGRGRIWRLVYDGMAPDPAPRLFDETAAQLVLELDHPNGWRRDTAQRLLVLSQAFSVGPQLRAAALSGPTMLGRLHALWTLEGLGRLDDALVLALLQDPNSKLRAAALRVGESLFKAGHSALQQPMLAAMRDPDPSVALQAVMSDQLLQLPGWRAEAAALVRTTASGGVRELGAELLKSHERFVTKGRTPGEIQRLLHGQEIFDSLCFACHGRDARGTPLGEGTGLTIAPPLVASRIVLGPQDGLIAVLLHGLTGPTGSGTYPAQMIAMGENDDEWIAAVASFVRNIGDNAASLITSEAVARVRAATLHRTSPWSREELAAQVLPPPVLHPEAWKVTASDSAATSHLALDGQGRLEFHTPKTQTSGEWLQIELPKAAVVTGLSLDAGTASGDFPRSYQVEASLDGIHWGKPVTAGKGTAVLTYAAFAPVEAQFLRITLTETTREGFPWSLSQLQVYSPRGEATPSPRAKN